ncbi:b1eef965-3b7c-45f9-9c8f-c4b66f9ff910 [Thermothielavioides terrestris]|uniref:B1eef965-3b7c-45f9-9c8f-c4b66f9ff910 n=1 Tax=Thermothielavioides terrestris TaxID=2587410 RepID=A0A446BW34_9PEZI|nr:b1eef965-3b7c-45f9-9c8f-c4b66f9ff910 [Thermothielavioides terrestris]
MHLHFALAQFVHALPYGAGVPFACPPFDDSIAINESDHHPIQGQGLGLIETETMRETVKVRDDSAQKPAVPAPM